ncbi:TetR/AcrR family transcriptional regulator [Arthrobacter sp. N1]|uniref:TetR/AcrR family transcriptional regulator n=1 Tax=Arthrobacter sp. N1 TaxID=619291 RepID=UPI003BAEC8E1
MTVDMDAPRAELRAHIIEGAARLLREGGAAAVTTRRVADAAGVQAPTIYRLFGDKDGLLDAIAEHVMAVHVAGKAAHADGHQDPVEALRSGWRMQMDFGLSNPELIRLMNARPGTSPAIETGIEVLQGRIHALATAGLLQVSERRALEMIHAAGTGAVQALLETPPERRDPGLADALFEAVLNQITRPRRAVDETGSNTSITVNFATLVPQLPGLSAAERSLMVEWLNRSIQTAQQH